MHDQTAALIVPTKLQRRLIGQIVQYCIDGGIRAGQPVTVVALAAALKVSRTPVRGALDHLAALGFVRATRRGFELTGSPPPPDDDEAVLAPEDELTLRIAHDYVANTLPAQVSEADLMRRYDVTRGLVLRVLQRLARDLIIDRNQGHGWTFAPLLRAGAGHDDSYRFRLAIEPVALLEPTFALDPAWLARCRDEHCKLLATPPARLSMIRFFEVNAAFHDGMAAASGNPFFSDAVESQNRLRRFLAYDWSYENARVVESCAEHLAVLDAAEAGDMARASALMRDHLNTASEFGERG